MKIKLHPSQLFIAGLFTTLPLKTCTKQPIKFTNSIVDTVTFAQKPLKTILVADDFKINDIDINGDFLGDVAHGFVTSSIIEKGLPDAKIVKCHIFPENGINNLFVAKNLDNLLSSVLKNMNNGKKFDAINLSFGFAVKYDGLSKETGIKLNPENIALFAKQIRNILKNKNGQFFIKSKPMKEIVSILDKMDEITSKGTKIYIAAGNSCDESFNLLTLANNVINVGANNKKGRFAIYSNNNTLVNRIENGDICPKAVKDGFDITDDGIADVKKEETTAIFNLTTPFAKFEGTSFASPRALVKDLLKKN